MPDNNLHNQLIQHSRKMGELLAVVDYSIQSNKNYIPYGHAVALDHVVNSLKNEAQVTFNLLFNSMYNEDLPVTPSQNTEQLIAAANATAQSNNNSMPSLAPIQEPISDNSINQDNQPLSASDDDNLQNDDSDDLDTFVDDDIDDDDDNDETGDDGVSTAPSPDSNENDVSQLFTNDADDFDDYPDDEPDSDDLDENDDDYDEQEDYHDQLESDTEQHEQQVNDAVQRDNDEIAKSINESSAAFSSSSSQPVMNPNSNNQQPNPPAAPVAPQINPINSQSSDQPAQSVVSGTNPAPENLSQSDSDDLFDD